MSNTLNYLRIAMQTTAIQIDYLLEASSFGCLFHLSPTFLFFESSLWLRFYLCRLENICGKRGSIFDLNSNKTMILNQIVDQPICIESLRYMLCYATKLLQNEWANLIERDKVKRKYVVWISKIVWWNSSWDYHQCL